MSKKRDGVRIVDGRRSDRAASSAQKRPNPNPRKVKKTQPSEVKPEKEIVYGYDKEGKVPVHSDIPEIIEDTKKDLLDKIEEGVKEKKPKRKKKYTKPSYNREND